MPSPSQITSGKKLLYYFPLETRDFEALRKGKLVIKHYHPNLEPSKMLIVVAWNRSILDSLERKVFENALKAGIDVANIPLREENIRKLETTNDGFTIHYGVFEILLISAETLAKLQKEKEIL